jgi:superfamily II DNA or RNA helicase
VPKIKIIKIPVDYKVKELRKYQDVYEQGIVKNRSRNRMIIKTAKDLAVLGKTSLILITRIDHGENLVETANLLGFKVVFIQGKDDGKMREMIRESLNNKEILTVISTNIWKEGVDLPALDCVINAAGGKSEIVLLQSIGRGLRATKDKDSVLIVDFLDLSHHYLISHFGERLAIFSEMDWL